MKKIYEILYLVLCAALANGGLGLAQAQDRQAPLVESGGGRERVVDVARSLVGLREETGRNDGPLVEKILAFVGLEKGDPWCAAANFYCYQQAGEWIRVPRSGWSPDWVEGAQWKQGRGPHPQPGDTFGIYFESKGRVAHTGMIERWGDAVTTLEGNTGATGSVGEADRNGDGYYRKRRLKRQIYAVRDWFP